MNKAFYLDDWWVEPDLDRISRDGVDLNLRPQVMDLLVYLARHPREVVTHEDILANVWTGRVTTDASIYNCLTELRHALGDDPHEPHYIETIPKRGYRLVAGVEWTGRRANGAAPLLRRLRRGLGPAGIPSYLFLLLLLVAVLIVAERWPNHPSASPVNTGPGPDAAIAVLPFRHLGSMDGESMLAEGLTEQIRDDLSRVPGLQITGKPNPAAYRGREQDPVAMGARLGVAFLLDGTIRQDGERFRISANLIDTRNGYRVWSREYDHELAETIHVQDEIGADLAGELRDYLDARP
jgi:TolB-like protein/DNA-binding winged helix-turn-helix (wHTH) protein